MERKIVGFFRDAVGDWVARLDCGHGQHVRHNPPLESRPWVLEEAGRQAQLGQRLNCLRCEAFEMPASLIETHRTLEFSAATIPLGLLSDHATSAGVWAKIHVLEGQLVYTVMETPPQSFTLDAVRPGIIVPERRHKVTAVGPVRFFVAFYRWQ